MAKKISIYTIATEAGVSTATVSKVINNTGYVSEEISEKILQIIRKYNYVPTQKKHSDNAIGVVCFYNERLLASPFSSKLMTGISAQAFKTGHELLLIDGNALTGMSAEELYRYRFSRSTCGFLLLNADFDSPILQTMTQANVPFINIANACNENKFNYISSNNFESAQEIVDYMICMGHRRIAIAGVLLKRINSHKERFDGYCAAMEKHQLTIDDSFVVELSDQEPETIANAVKRLMGRAEPPTAIFFINTECGNLIYSTLIAEKYKVPGDISLAGCYEMPESFPSQIDFTSFCQPAEEMGELAVINLKKITENTSTRVHLRVKNTISYGKTVKKIS